MAGKIAQFGVYCIYGAIFRPDHTKLTVLSHFSQNFLEETLIFRRK